jgi:hypothetical protein
MKSVIKAKSAGHEEWEAMTQLVNRLSTVLLDRLPDFWRIVKGHMEGKYSKVCACDNDGPRRFS